MRVGVVNESERVMLQCLLSFYNFRGGALINNHLQL